MKRLLILFTFSIITIAAHAQFGVGGGGPSVTGRISGTVIDSLTKKPIDYATITLYRSGGKVPLNGVVTDEKGVFKINNVNSGKYKVTVSFIGYPTKTIDPVTTTPGKPDFNLGSIRLSPSGRMLKGVDVVGQQSLIESRIDKIVFNAEKDVTSAGGNATDILQKVPLVAVDINGNVSLRGDQNVRVLINGKPSGAMSASMADVLKTIPADQIKSVEVITSPSAKYDAEGSAGIINIITKQKNISGISGSVSGGVGTRQNNGNANINFNKNRLSLSANLGGNQTWPQTTHTDFIQNIYSDTSNITNHNTSTSKLKRYGYTGSVSAGYDFNNFNNLNTTFRFNDGGFNTDGSQQNVQTNTFRPTLNRTGLGTTYSHNHFAGFDWNLDYTRKFKKEGHELSVSAQWSHSIINTDYSNIFTAINPSQKGNNDGINNEYTLQTDYSLPVNKLLKIEAGGKTIQRRISSEYDIYSLNSQNDFIFDAYNSNLYDYNQNVYAGYSVLTFTLPKSYSLLVGGRVENTAIKGIPNNNLQPNLTPFTQNYTTFIPSLTIQKAITSTQTIKLGYSKRIQRPSLQYLNPFINRSNEQSQSVGNPTLSPELSQTLELNYNTFIKSSVINLSTYYKHTSNLIEGIASPITEVVNGTLINGTRTSFTNIGNNNSFGASFFGSINPVKILTIRGSINTYTYKPDPSGIYHLSATQNGTYLQYNAFLSGSLNFSNGLVVETFVIANSARRTIQGTNPSFSLYVLGLKKQFLKKKAAFGFNTVTPFSGYKNFNQNISSPGFTQVSKTAVPFRSFGLTFSYSFGKVSFSNPQQKQKGVNNDDLKQGDTGGGVPSGSNGSGTGRP